ncbi:hypothetical protein LQZ19_16360 [Treponema primitia]|uniref:hypothetical protein n=1 Tax=Treponema primitia TaxID=88058 RepID=UPI00397EF04F
MKKRFFLGIVFLLPFSFSLFAEDAALPPVKTVSFSLTPAFEFADLVYGYEGGTSYWVNETGLLRVFSTALTLGYGILDWISAEARWKPGWTIASNAEFEIAYELNNDGTKILSNASLNANDLSDIFLEAKIQIIGEKAPIQSSRWRFTLGPEIKIPLPGTDFEEQFNKAGTADTLTVLNGDNHVFGLGSRVYTDYRITRHFAINLSGEFLYYLGKNKLKDSSFLEYMAARIEKKRLLVEIANSGGDETAQKAEAAKVENTDEEVGYGYDLSVELEPAFTIPLGADMVLSAGLPVQFKFNSGKTYSFLGVEEIVYGAVTNKDRFEKVLNENYPGLWATAPNLLVTVRPNVSVFFINWKLPTEFAVSYAIPVWGLNRMASYSISLQVKTYLGAGLF